MPTPTVNPLPNPPSRSNDPINFAIEADAFVAALPTWTTEINTAGVYISAAADAASVNGANFKGAYSAGTTYQIGDTTLYNDFFWIAVTINTGVTPVDGANWRNISLVDGGAF